MKNMIIGAVLGVFAAGAAMADPAAGMWKSQPGETGGYIHVKISPCGAQICGKIVKVVGNDNDSIIGKKIIWAMNNDGGGNYSGGKVWAPDTDKTYSSKLKLSGSKLKVSGCVLGICRSQNWSRIN